MIVLIEQRLDAIRSLCREYGVVRLDIFGSAAREDFDPQRSDIDLLVEFAPGTDLGPWMARFFELQERLETVLGRKVDLVMAKGVHNPYCMTHNSSHYHNSTQAASQQRRKPGNRF